MALRDQLTGTGPEKLLALGPPGLASVSAIPQMQEIGRAVAARKIRLEHFARFPA